MRAAAVILLVSGLAGSLAAQQPTQSLRGTVRDSASGQPILGAVILLRDSAGVTVARTLSGDLGRYQVVATRRAKDMQLLRIGFRPREIALPAPSDGVMQFDVAMAQIPTLLEPVRTLAASRCRARSDAAAAFGVLSQARAALLATIVAREAKPATMTLVRFKRYMAGLSDSVERQTVRLVSQEGAKMSFNASYTALDFVQDGFRRDSAGQHIFFGPDAEVLLDEGFSRAYCFSIARADTAHRNQVGLAFAPVARRNGRIDIRGSLWIDTVARSLREVSFVYLGLDRVSEGLNAGGQVSFREMDNGVTLIDRWSLRMVGAADSVIEDKSGVSVHRGLLLQEVGGILANAKWPDGHEWTASLAKLRLAVTDRRGDPARGRSVGLDSTDYHAVTDVAGNAEIEYLVPGPYRVTIVDPELAPLGVAIPTDLEFRAVRDATIALELRAPSAAQFLSDICKFEGTSGDAPALFGRVTTIDGDGVSGARWRLARASNGGWQTIADGGKTGSTGLFHHCRKIGWGETIRIEAWREGESPTVVTRRVTSAATILPLQLNATVASDRRASVLTHTFEGTVKDSSTGRAVPDAHVALVGTATAARTDSAGRFTISGMRPGRYTAEVRTWTLDALGVVSQSPVVLSDAKTPLTLYVPTAAQIASTLCTTDSSSPPLGPIAVVAGRAEVRGDTLPPEGLRVVAAWNAGQKKGTRSVESFTDARGVFRLCGVPRETDVVVRAATEGVTGDSVLVRVAANDALATADLSLAPAVALPTMVTTEKVTIPAFERNRKLGIGHFLTRAELEKRENQRLADALSNLPGLGATRGRGGRGYVLSKHAPPHLAPRASSSCGKSSNMCPLTNQGLNQQGVWCPSTNQRNEGEICGCYAQIYIDGILVNPGKPTEPYDINSIPTSEIEGVEFYSGPATTPIEYARTGDTQCGVLVLWMRRGRFVKGS